MNQQNIHSCYSCPLQTNDHCKLKMIDVFLSVMNKEIFPECPLIEGVIFKAVIKESVNE